MTDFYSSSPAEALGWTQVSDYSPPGLRYPRGTMGGSSQEKDGEKKNQIIAYIGF